MVFGYTRVSTQLQFLENQEYGIKEYCKTHALKVDAWYEEKVSGTKAAAARKLGELVNIVKRGDIIIVTEISRIGRSVVDCLKTINDLKQKGVVLISIKENFVLDESLSSLMISTIFSLIAQVDREILSQRVKEGLAARRARGQKLGRPFGSKNKRSKLCIQKEFIEMCLATGKTRYYIKKHLKCHSHTLNKYLKTSGLAKKYLIAISNKL